VISMTFQRQTPTKVVTIWVELRELLQFTLRIIAGCGRFPELAQGWSPQPFRAWLKRAMPHQNCSRHVAGFPTRVAGADRGARRKYLPAALALGGINVGIRVSGGGANVFASVLPGGRGALHRASRGFNRLSSRASNKQQHQVRKAAPLSVYHHPSLQLDHIPNASKIHTTHELRSLFLVGRVSKSSLISNSAAI
jgi:hypothetical protein